MLDSGREQTGKRNQFSSQLRPVKNNEQGYVTVETALSLLSLIAIFSLIMAGMSYGIATIHSCNTLRAVSRAISLGKPLPKLGSSQNLRISEKGGYVEAVISESSLLASLKLAPAASCKVAVIPEPKEGVGAF